MHSAHEPRIQEIGRQLHGGMRDGKPGLFSSERWSAELLEWAMRDKAFKTELFRFVDVFPVLETPEQVAQHLDEYLLRPGLEAPMAVRVALRGATTGFGARAATAQLTKNLETMAGRFIAGRDGVEAGQVAATYRQAGQAFSVDLLGEAVLSLPEARAYEARVMALIESLSDVAAGWAPNAAIDQDDAGPLPRANVSLKLSALLRPSSPLSVDADLHEACEALGRVFRRARDRGVAINVDMEHSALKELTLRAFTTTLDQPDLQGWRHAAIAIQAYLRTAESDVDTLVRWARQSARQSDRQSSREITVRLVKGAYWDAEVAAASREGWPSPVYAQKWESDASFERCAFRLIQAHPQVRLAVASHNLRSIAAALAFAEAARLPAGALEFQSLHGMAEPVREALVLAGHRVRVYCPVGDLVPGMAYLVRRLLENTSNASWLRLGFVEQRPLDELMAPPAPAQPPDAQPPAETTKRGWSAWRWFSGARRPAPSALSTASPERPQETGFRNEPLRDFSEPAARQAFAEALHTATRGGWFALPTGEESAERARAMITQYDPSRLERAIGQVGYATVEEAEASVRRAESAAGAWGRLPAAERSALIRRLAQSLRAHRDELAARMVVEVGKPWDEADGDVCEAIDFCEYYAEGAEALFAPRLTQRVVGELNVSSVLPRGITVVIAPWNFPLAIATGMTVAALATGNPVILKPAEQSSLIAARFVELARGVGIPAGVLQLLPGRGETVGAHLVAHPKVSTIAFTGSLAVGTRIWAQAAELHPGQRGLKRVICEMGGKNSIIVDEDADLDDAVQGVVRSAFGFSGQKCSACSRVIVLERRYAAFTARLTEATESLRFGSAHAPETRVGPVIDAESAARLERLIAAATQRVTRLTNPLPPPEGLRGHYVSPVVFGAVPPDDLLATHEHFGPVLAVSSAASLDHALELANATAYGLTGGVYSRLPSTLARVSQELAVGNVYINRPITGAIVGRQPFGGLRLSGGGTKAGGPDYLLSFVDLKVRSENTLRHGFTPDLL